MTVTSYSAKNSIFTIFGGRRSDALDSPLLSRKNRNKKRISRYSLLFFALLFLSAGIFFLGIHSIILSFQTYKLQQLTKNLMLANEELRVSALERSQPDILAEEAAMLQLSQRGNVRYLVLEPPTLAGSFRENLQQ